MGSDRNLLRTCGECPAAPRMGSNRNRSELPVAVPNHCARNGDCASVRLCWTCGICPAKVCGLEPVPEKDFRRGRPKRVSTPTLGVRASPGILEAFYKGCKLMCVCVCACFYCGVRNQMRRRCIETVLHHNMITSRGCMMEESCERRQHQWIASLTVGHARKGDGSAITAARPDDGPKRPLPAVPRLTTMPAASGGERQSAPATPRDDPRMADNMSDHHGQDGTRGSKKRPRRTGRQVPPPLADGVGTRAFPRWAACGSRTSIADRASPHCAAGVCNARRSGKKSTPQRTGTHPSPRLSWPPPTRPCSERESPCVGLQQGSSPGSRRYGWNSGRSVAALVQDYPRSACCNEAEECRQRMARSSAIARSTTASKRQGGNVLARASTHVALQLWGQDDDRAAHASE